MPGVTRAPATRARAYDLGGTVRAAPVEATLARAREVARAIGVTRVANVTGLDHVGVPTWTAVRPLARSLTVAQGKGTTDALAQASALMESIEAHHAEHYTPRGPRASLRSAAADARYVDPLLLPVRPHVRVAGATRVEWIEGRELRSGVSRFVPRDCVDLDFARARRDERVFVGSSNGLASGNTRDEAILHGLCETIERDQTSFWYARRQLLGTAADRLALDTVDDPGCRSIVERCRAAGLVVAAWSMVRDIAVPSFTCTVYDRESLTYYPQRAAGFGCHPYRRIALSRALTEALQSRLTCIAGGRDDVYWSEYRDTLRVDNARGRAWIEEQEAEAAALDFATVAEAPADASIGALVDWSAAALAAAGLREIVVVDLTQPRFAIPVVNVSVPGLEGLLGKPGYTPGPRMQAFLSGRLPR